MHTYTLLEANTPQWGAAIDELYAAFGSPAEHALLPAYFVKTSFARMGGLVLRVDSRFCLLGMAMLVPRAIEQGHQIYTLRLHDAPGQHLDAVGVAVAVEALLAPARVRVYRPLGPHNYGPTHESVGPFDLGAPDAAEAAAIPVLHQAIWQTAAEARFPADIHSPDFGLGTSLVARHNGAVVGFLLGFVSFGASGVPGRAPMGIESQTIGIDPAYRRYGLAAMLKRRQAQQARERGFSLIHWTADPLQWPNAGLNFGRLRAIAGTYYHNYYPFRNALNRVHPSRLGITWLLDTAHGQAGLVGDTTARPLEAFADVYVLNIGTEPTAPPPKSARYLAIEIPADWTTLQQDDLAMAQRWRDATDRLLDAVIGFGAGRYVITDAASSGERRYLVAQAFTPELVS